MLYDLFSEFFGDDLPLFTTRETRSVPNKICPVCGMSLAEFAKKGKLGCPDCYEHFRPYLAAVLKNIHSNTVHTGKISKNADAKIKLKREMENLEAELKDAVSKQEYEKAATIRDKINEIKAKEEM